jgi:hypothetical protein
LEVVVKKELNAMGFVLSGASGCLLTTITSFLLALPSSSNLTTLVFLFFISALACDDSVFLNFLIVFFVLVEDFHQTMSLSHKLEQFGLTSGNHEIKIFAFDLDFCGTYVLNWLEASRIKISFKFYTQLNFLLLNVLNHDGAHENLAIITSKH